MSKHLSETRTETVAQELLDIQGWQTSKPPKGRVVRQNEYKAFPHLSEIFKGKSKKGKGDAYPDFLVVSEGTPRPQLVIETKADEAEFSKAIDEACNIYGKACIE